MRFLYRTEAVQQAGSTLDTGHLRGAGARARRAAVRPHARGGTPNAKVALSALRAAAWSSTGALESLDGRRACRACIVKLFDNYKISIIE